MYCSRQQGGISEQGDLGVRVSHQALLTFDLCCNQEKSSKVLAHIMLSHEILYKILQLKTLCFLSLQNEHVCVKACSSVLSHTQQRRPQFVKSSPNVHFISFR